MTKEVLMALARRDLQAPFKIPSSPAQRMSCQRGDMTAVCFSQTAPAPALKQSCGRIVPVTLTGTARCTR